MDKLAPLQTGEPLTGIAICGEPRSGTTYLADLMTSTGRLGKPFEWFQDGPVAARAEKNPQLELRAMMAKAKTANGVYGIKIFSQQFDLAERTRWADLLPNLHFVHIERRDLLAQAISHVRAMQTKQFYTTQVPIKEPHYDPRAISRKLSEIAHNQARWRIWFARNGIVPLALTYEQLCDDGQAAIDSVCALIGHAPAPINTDAIKSEILRGTESDDWKRRFVEDMTDRAHLDDQFFRLRARLRRARLALSPYKRAIFNPKS